MARGKAKSGAEEAAGSTGKPGHLSGMEAVRQALRVLGYDAETQKIHDYILDQFSKEMSNNMISSYKSTLRREAGLSKGRGGRPAGRSAAAAAAAALQVEDVQAIKNLVGRLGADRVRELIGVFH